ALADAGDADVVQQAREVEVVEDGRRHPQTLADLDRDPGHAFAVAVCVRHVGVDGGGQALDQPAHRVGHPPDQSAAAPLVHEDSPDQGHDAQVVAGQPAVGIEVDGHDPARV